MSEIDGIKDKLGELAIHAALSDQAQKTMQKTQDDLLESQKTMIEILGNQSRQKEKNKGFDSSTHRLNQESIQHGKDIAANKDAIAANKLSLAVIIARSTVISAPVAGILVMIFEYATKAPVG